MIPDREAILAEIVEMNNPPPQQLDEFTTREFTDAGGASCPATAQRQLDKLVSDGVLTKRMTRVHGRMVWVYKKAASTALGSA